MEKMLIKLSQRNLRDNAMAAQGLSTAKMAIKLSVRVERNRKHLAKIGVVKHKSRAYTLD